MKWFWIGMSGMALVAGVVLLMPMKSLTPEQQIQAVIAQGIKALESQDVGGATALLDDGYRDTGGRNRDAMKGIAFMGLRRGPVFIARTHVDVSVASDGASATAQVQGIVLQGPATVAEAKDLLPTRGRAFDVTVAFVHDDDEWLVTSIDGLSASFID